MTLQFIIISMALLIQNSPVQANGHIFLYKIITSTLQWKASTETFKFHNTLLSPLPQNSFLAVSTKPEHFYHNPYLNLIKSLH